MNTEAVQTHNPPSMDLTAQPSSQIGTKGCSLAASLVLLLYDHALTFGDEVNEFWTLRLSPTGTLILIVRYFAILSRGLDMFGRCLNLHVRISSHSITAFFYTGWTPTVCSIMKKIEFPIISSVITIVLVHMIMLLRIFALYGTHKPILASLILLLVGEVAIIITGLYVLINPQDLPVPGCLLGRAASNTINKDTIIFILTLTKSKQYAKLTNDIPISLMKVFLRDGFLYYLILGIIHALNALIFILAPFALKTVATGFIQAAATIIISRLLFNLRMQALRPKTRLILRPPAPF
ncbi:hypothetical protein K439DRAFT_306472 [Ramaria rubella]|nr:hypothetical protein K439DRAFT_306472 [Ramaria rubella]